MKRTIAKVKIIILKIKREALVKVVAIAIAAIVLIKP
jgi:hypothetical protein